MNDRRSPFHRLSGVRLRAIRAALPETEIRLEDEAPQYADKKKAARLRLALGMDRRRVAAPDVTASDLCAHAAESILAAHPEARNATDALLFVSQSPDWHQPPTACELQHRLGLPRSCAALDVNQGCAGYVYGLWLSAALIASGAASRALLLAGDVHAAGRDMRNRVTSPVFGDGGSATLLEKDAGAPDLVFGLGTDGSGFEAIITPAGNARIPFSFDPEANVDLVTPVFDREGNPWRLVDTWMDGGAVFNFTMQTVPDHLRALIAYAGNPPVDALILHQANRHIVESIAERAGFSRKLAPASSFTSYGNLAVASIPVQLCESFGEGRAPGRLALCGYGIGLSWASCLCEPGRWDCAAPLTFVPDPARPTRAQRIESWKQRFRGER